MSQHVSFGCVQFCLFTTVSLSYSWPGIFDERAIISVLQRVEVCCVYILNPTGIGKETNGEEKKKKLGNLLVLGKRQAFCFVLFLSFCYFLGRSHGIWRFLGQGSNRSCGQWPTPEPQQRGIQGASVTYTTAHCNAGSLTH